MKRAVVVGLIWSVATVASAQAPKPANPTKPAPGAQAAAARPSSSQASSTNSACVLSSKAGEQYVESALVGFDPAVTSTPLPVFPANSGAAMVICIRTTLVPQLTDYRVITEMHLPLAIKAGEKTLFLGLDQGKLQIALPEGQTPPTEVEQLRTRIEEMQIAMAALPPAKK